jgi:hypothetical protein
MAEKDVQLANLESVAKSLSVVAIPVVLAIGSWYIQNAISSRSVEQAYVELAVSVLTAGEEEVDSELRDWAVTLLNSYSAVELQPAVAQRLASGKIGLPERTYELGTRETWWQPIRGTASFELTEGAERYGIKLINCGSGECTFEFARGVGELTHTFSLETGATEEVQQGATGGPVVNYEIELIDIASSRLGSVVSIRVRDRGHPLFSP